MRSRFLLTALLVPLTLVFGCGSDVQTPTKPDSPTVVERPTTVATARATTAASVWAMNDLAALAAHWVDGDLRSSPARFTTAAFGDVASFDDATTIWTVPLMTDFRIGPEVYEVGGTARITYRANDDVVADAHAATSMDAVVTLDLLPRLGRTLQRDLEMTSTIRMTIEDLGSRPFTVSGDGSTVGRYSLVDDDTDQRAAVDVRWTFELSDVFRECCASGVVDLTMGAWATEVTLIGAPEVATRMAVGDEWVEDVAVDLPCVRVREARGTSLRTPVPLLAAAHGRAPALDLVSSIDQRSTTMGERTSGTLSLEGYFRGEPFPLVSTPLDRSVDVREALAALAARMYDTGRWPIDLDIDARGHAVFDNRHLGSIPRATERVTIWGNLESDSDARGTRLIQTSPLLAVATAADDLRLLHSGADGDDLSLVGGDAIALVGRIAGVDIADEPFVIGATAYGLDGTTLEDLQVWFQTALRRKGAADATVRLEPDGSVVVVNDTTHLMEDIRLVSGGRVTFDQTMNFGRRIDPGSRAGSTASLLAPAEVTDVVGDLRNGDGDRLNFQFEDDGSRDRVSTVSVEGTLGGRLITPASIPIVEGVTLLGELLDGISRALNISNVDGVWIDDRGRIHVQGDVGLDNAIGNISVTEQNFLFSNLSTSIDFRLQSEARDAITFSTTIPVYDSLGETHDMTLSFTKRSGVNAWDWEARFDDDEVILSGGHGTVAFDENGRLVRWQHADASGAVSFRPQAADTSGAEVVTLVVDPGDPEATNGLTQYGWSDQIRGVADGHGYNAGIDASEVVVRLTSTDGVVTENVVLARFPRVDGGTVVTGNLLAVGARGGTPLSRLITAAGVPLVSEGTESLTLAIEATVDSEPVRSTATVDPATFVVGDLLAAIAAALDVPPSGVSLDATGHLVVDAPVERGPITRLAVGDDDGAHPNLGSTLDIRVTAQGSAGCR